MLVTLQLLREAQKLSQHQSFPFYRPVSGPLDRVCLLWSKLCLWLGNPVRRKRIRQYSSSRTCLQHFKRIQWMRELAVVHVKTRDTLLNSTSKAVIMSSHPYPSLTSFNDLLLWKPFSLLTWKVACRISVFWWGWNRNFVSYRHLGWWKGYRGIFFSLPFAAVQTFGHSRQPRSAFKMVDLCLKRKSSTRTPVPQSRAPKDDFRHYYTLANNMWMSQGEWNWNCNWETLMTMV